MITKILLSILFLLASCAYTQGNKQGETYYFSFSKAKPSDPERMQNSANIQAKSVSYAIEKLGNFHLKLLNEHVPIQHEPIVTPALIKKQFLDYKKILTPDDRFISYTFSHGVKKGMLLTSEHVQRKDPALLYQWRDFAQDILDLPSRDVIILTMACYSGNFTNILKQDSNKKRWNTRKSHGRNFLVITAANENQESRPNRINGKLENPFNYAVRTALEGNADGFQSDGTITKKDKKITFKEFVAYVLLTTREKSGDSKDPTYKADPQAVGDYNENEILVTLP